MCILTFLFVCGLTSHSKFFHSFGDVIINGEGLQILIYARHTWPLSSEGSWACYTYCDTGRPFIIVICEYPWRTCCWALGGGVVITCLKDLGLSWPGIEPRSFRMRGKRSTTWLFDKCYWMLSFFYTCNSSKPTGPSISTQSN